MPVLSPGLRYIDSIVKSTSIEQAWQIHTSKMAQYGFDRLLYGANKFRTHGDFGDLSDALILTNHDSDYIDLFFGKAFYLHAPMTQWAAHNTGVCSWQWSINRREAGLLSDQELEIIAINDKMGVHAGVSISFTQIHKRATSAIGLCARRGISQKEVDDIFSRHGAEIEVYNNVFNQKIMSLPFERTGKKLTPRQREVLHWVADGKTLQDIAIILGLTQATIEKHIRLARETLNADTTAQAILKASLNNQFFVFEGLQAQAISPGDVARRVT